MALIPLTDAEIAEALQTLVGWQREGDKLVKTVKLTSYTAGLAYATTIGILAEGFNHHPDLYIGYKTVRIEFTTHDGGSKITKNDIDIARAINALPYPHG